MIRLYRVRENRYRRDGEPPVPEAYIVAHSPVEAVKAFTQFWSTDNLNVETVDSEHCPLHIGFSYVAVKEDGR